MMRRTILLLAVVAALGGCGGQTALKPAPGKSLPPKAATAPRAATVDELLTPPTQARPERRDELYKRSMPRADDRFDLPPPG